MRFPLLAMTVLGLSLIAYGFFSLLRHNPEVRAQVMQQLPPEYQVQLTNLLNGNVDIAGRIATINAIDSNATCNGPAETCKTTPGKLTPPVPPQYGSPPPAQAAPPKEYDPATAGAAETLNELKKVREKNKETNKMLEELSQ